MSGVKTLFEKQKEAKSALKNLESKNIQNFSSDVVSVEYVSEYQKSINLYLQDVNFATASNFAKFGSARKYYENIVNRITNYFPYDGSKAEQLEFENNLNPFEKYIYLYEYPRSTGYVNFSPNGWGTAVNPGAGVGIPTNKEYISFYNQNNDNIYDPENGLRENTRFIFTSGSTVEFWMKKNAFVPVASSSYECIFYMASTGSDNKDKTFNIYLAGIGSTSSIYTSFYDTTNIEFIFQFNTGLSTIADSKWHHYAFTYYSSSAGYTSEFYLDGVYKQTQAIDSTLPFVDITGSSFCTIGAFGGDFAGTSYEIGSAKLSASIDEFRFWNVRRNAKQIGLNYFTNVGGGNDKIGNEGLGIYFKFNEGILGDYNSDSLILDYAGGNCNGLFTGYSNLSRSTGSAITQTQEKPEKGTPILFYNHSSVQQFLDEKLLISDEYDFSNNFALKNSMPSWILDEDSDNGETLTNFLQTIASYLDTLYLQITTYKNLKNKEYLNYKGKAPPFSDLLLTSNGFDLPSLFLNTDIVQSLLDQDINKTYDEKINDLKNVIYKNIYNNLNIIYKSKGTENAIKQLIKNFGVDDNVFSLNIYANNTQYQLEDNYINKSLKKEYIDFTPFSSSINSQAVIYQSGSYSFITGTNDPAIPFTLETDIIIPKFPPSYDKLSYQTLTYNTSSVFGIRTANNTENDTTVPINDDSGLKVKFIYRDDRGYFNLNCVTASLNLNSNIFEDITDDQHWNLSVKLVPVHTGSSYNLIFSGYCNFASDLFREFSVSSSLTYAQGYKIINNNKRVYIGAERNNITGTIVHNSLIKALSVRYWIDNLDEAELKSHARDPYNYGRLYPSEPYSYYTSSYLPKSETLLLHWDFSTVTSSDMNGNIQNIYDLSSGSLFTNNPFNSIIGKTYNAAGYGFYQNASIKHKDYVFSSEQQIPENLYSSQLINILETDDDYYTTNIRPQKYFFALENSMYDVISKNMLEMFATISEFNNYIGDPINLYKSQYSRLNYFRKLFFSKVENVPDLDKYVEIYKWIDDALDSILFNLLPASANASDKVRTIVENHILERNKVYYPIIPNKNVEVNGGSDATIGDIEPPPGSPPGTDPNPAPGKDKSGKQKRFSLDGIEKQRYSFNPRYEKPIGSFRDQFLLEHDARPSNYDSVSYFNPKSTAPGIQRTKNFAFRSNKYNIVHRDIERDLEHRGYQDENYFSSNESNSLDKWYKYRATADDQTIFTTSSATNTRIQINDSVTRFCDFLESRQISIESENQYDLHSGYNFNKEKLAFFVEEYLLNNPGQYFQFVQDPNQIILNVANLQIKNILIYKNSIAETNTTLPGSKISGSSFIGHHKDGLFEYGIQGPFTEQHVGGFKHRHVKIGTINDRPERFILEESGSTLIFKSPLTSSSGLNYNNPYSRFSRQNLIKSVVNTQNILFTNSVGGNYDHNYELVNTFTRYDQNLAFVDRPNNFVINNTDSPYVSGTVNYLVPDQRLANNNYNKTVFVHKFGSPGDVNSTNHEYMDSSGEFSPYNTVNYRNPTIRSYFNELSSVPSYFGGYLSNSYGNIASFQKNHRNNRRIPISGTNQYRLREDNSFVGYAIPATDRGYIWIDNYVYDSNSEGLYVNGIDNSITYVSKSFDNYCFNSISGNYLTVTTSSYILNTNENDVLRKFIIQYNGLWNYTTKQQLMMNYNKWVRKNIKQNYYSDEVNDDTKENSRLSIISIKDSFIKDKHKNIINVYVDEKNIEEKISIPFAEEFQSFVSDFYQVQHNQNINIYRDQKNKRDNTRRKNLSKKSKYLQKFC